MFGDSWTVYYNEQLPKKIQQLTSATWVKNFGVSGAVMNDITTKQIPNALNDPTVTDIDGIIIVVGANDIFWGNETLQQIKDAATNMAITLTQNYKSIPIHVFLDSSRTSSAGRINYYKDITDILTNYGITVHEDILYYFWANNGNLYRSDADGRENVLHLSPDGYDKLAGLISAHLMGAPTIGTRVLGQCTPDWLYNIGGTSPWSDTPPDVAYGIKFSNYAQSRDNSFLTYENGHVYYNFHFLIEWTNQAAPDATGVMELISYPEIGFKTAYDDTKQFITCPPRQLVVGNAFVTNGSDPRYIRTECYARTGANGTTRMTVRLMRESTAQWQKFTDVYGSIEWPMV